MLRAFCVVSLVLGADAFAPSSDLGTANRNRFSGLSYQLSSAAPRPCLSNPLLRSKRLQGSPGLKATGMDAPKALTEDLQSLSNADLVHLTRKIARASWLAWWSQVILSVVSGVTIFFANAVKGPAQASLLTNGVFLAGLGLAVAFVNVFWTWGYSRMGAKLTSIEDPLKQVRRIRGSIKLGTIIALVGMLITLFGAQQIVGTLVAKSITGTMFLAGPAASSPVTQGMQLQALDIFVVQANTNTLLSHWAAITSALYIATILPSD